MPRVLQVLEATIGGTRRHLRDLCLGLRDRGWEVDAAVALRRDRGFGSDLELFRSRGIGVWPVAMVRRPAPVGDGLAVRRLAGVVRQVRPDVIHAHSTKAGLLARLAVGTRGPPVVYTPHCFAFEMEAPRLRRALYRAVERACVPRTARLIAVSRAEQQAALELGYAPEQVHLIPNGIPSRPESPVETPRRYAVAFIGRFCRQKGIDLAIAALRRLAAGHPGLEFAVMGSGDRAATARLDDLPAVTVLPFGDAPAVQRLLAESRVLTLPSRWEGLPYLLLEAMEAGTAVVAAGVGGVTDVVTDGRDALVIPADDVAAQVRALARLLDDDALRLRLTAAARRRVAAFSLETMIAATEGVYRDGMQAAEPRSAAVGGRRG